MIATPQHAGRFFPGAAWASLLCNWHAALALNKRACKWLAQQTLQKQVLVAELPLKFKEPLRQGMSLRQALHAP